MMKILQFMASERYGGAEKVFVDLSNALCDRYAVTAVLLRDTEYRHRFSSGVELLTLRANPTRYNPFLQLELYRTLKRSAPNVLHTHAVKGTELVRNANRFLGIPHLATKHNDRKGSVFNDLPWVSAVSLAAKESIRSKGTSDVRVIYNGLTPKPVARESRAEVFTLLAVGRLDAIKGFALLIDQVAQLPFPFRLQIVGDGPERENLVQQIHRLGLEDSVRLLGFREDVPELMAAADVVVLSSFREGCPNVLLEALYYARVFISTPVGGSREVLPDHFLSEAHSLGSRLKQIHENYHAYEDEFSHLCQQKRPQFTFDNVVGEYARFYEDMVARS